LSLLSITYPPTTNFHFSLVIYTGYYPLRGYTYFNVNQILYKKSWLIYFRNRSSWKKSSNNGIQSSAFIKTYLVGSSKSAIHETVEIKKSYFPFVGIRQVRVSA